MLKYLIIQLDDTSTSFCSYEVAESSSPNLISFENLKKAIHFAFLENLNIQVVWPSYELPSQYIEVLNKINHINIVPSKLSDEADVVVANSITELNLISPNNSVVLRTTLNETTANINLVADCASLFSHLSIVFTDTASWSNDSLKEYQIFLNHLSKRIIHLYQNCQYPQINLLTDRIFLNKMNNCNAGHESIAICPDGNFYACPGFYFYRHHDSKLGSLDSGINIRNPQLYKLSHAPICSNCDAWQCRRCVLLNKKYTRELNTPGRMQCVISHIERNASRLLRKELINIGCIEATTLPIPEINYLDPFENRKEWL